MCRRIVLAWVLFAATAVSAHAQIPFARDLVPTRTALARVGLERQFMAVVPMQNDERVLGISMAKGMLFAQTNHGYLHTYDAESGRFLWTARLGPRSARSSSVSANSFAVFVTNLNKLFAIERRTGRTIWTTDLIALPTSSTSADEERVMVGLANGKIYAFGLKVPDEKKRMVISSRAIDAWNWQAEGGIRTRPVPAGMLVAFGSDDGKVYVSQSQEVSMLYRIATGGAIGTGMGTMGTRMLLIPSADQNLYALDLFTAKILWTFPSGAPIDQEPLVAGDDIYVVNNAGHLSSIDPANGAVRWTTSTRGGRLVTIGAKRIYLESSDDDLFMIARSNGQTIADARATYERAGLNLRAYEFRVRNRETDRLYFASSSGMLICLREMGETTPVRLRDPRSLPFGYIPKAGISLTPATPAPAETAPAGEKDTEKPAAAGETEKPAAAEEKEMEKPAAAEVKVKEKPEAEEKK